jgi:hypothetical protein
MTSKAIVITSTRCRVQRAHPTSRRSAATAFAARASHAAGRKAKLKEISYG